MGEVNIHTSHKVVFVCAGIVIVMAGIKAASAIVVPFLLSVFIAMATNPLINWAYRYRVPRWLSVIFVIFMIVVFGMMLAGLVGNSMNEFSENLPEYRQKLGDEFVWLASHLEAFNIHINREFLVSHFDPGMAMSMVTNLLSGFGNVLANFLLILLTVVFMLFEADSIPKKIHIALDDPSMKMQQVDKFLTSVKNYLAIKMLVSLATGVLIGIWLYVLNVDHFLLWAVVAFLFNFIPNIGSFIAAIPAVLLALVQLGPAVAGLTAIGYVVTNTVMGNMVEPRYMGKGLGLSTLVVFLSLIFWGWLLGTVGMLLSVPLTMIVKIALESNQDTKWMALLLAGDSNEPLATSDINK
ncbi:AI-2E family transporter [Aestuariibacter sp. AA17]|uniref:AI-2E family transporter n=1 Tax=Fluctibacter corallii TaxID=2984329 RepID=A0ABT3A5D8_9ALTE|nr:AI-2E family transporter [Aestuariibacter sp. AA17]MCV2883850.1 AI-2E family transporter [Aestuariibacter sp. AA17]